jgi:hypothetical protein
LENPALTLKNYTAKHYFYERDSLAS